MLILAALIHLISGSKDILYSLRGHEALRKFQQYGTSNIYGIKWKLSRRDIVPFPLIHKLEKNEHRHLSRTTETSATINTMRQTNVSRPKNVALIDKTYAITHSPSTSRQTQLKKQLSEIRKVKRIGGGYPYGPKNSTVSEFIRPLRFTKSLGFHDEILFKTPQNISQSTTAKRRDVWAIREPLESVFESAGYNFCADYVISGFQKPEIVDGNVGKQLAFVEVYSTVLLKK
uniref:Astacin domain-containing protein n=1 Tax=Angiostrongylus cantonensis TaxID=6313 RepID=A0A0K0DNU5_ANGCA